MAAPGGWPVGGGMPEMKTTVKNTFLEIVEPGSDEQVRGLVRSSSENDLSTSSSRDSSEWAGYSRHNGYWLPTGLLSSNSGQSAHSDKDTQLLAERHGLASSEARGVSSWAQGLGDAVEFFSAADVRAIGDSLGSAPIDQFRPAGSTPTARSLAAAAPSEEPLAPLADLHGDRLAFAIADDSPKALVERYSALFGISREVLQGLEDQGVLRDIPTSDFGLTSVGSIAHARGDCKPCAYWFRDVCKHGVHCQHCHIAHMDQKLKRLRPSKNARVRLRAIEQAAQDGKALDKDSLRKLLYSGRRKSEPAAKQPSDASE